MKKVFKEEISNWAEVMEIGSGILTNEELELINDYDISLADLKMDMKLSVEQFILNSVSNAYELEVVNTETSPVQKEVIAVLDENDKILATAYVWMYEEEGNLVYEVEIEGKH